CGKHQRRNRDRPPRMDGDYVASGRWIMPLTKDQAEMLTALVVAARPVGARRWDGPGVLAALAKVRHLELAEVMMAAGRAARDRDLETPAAIGNTAAPCWIERPVERTVPVKSTPAERCSVSGLPLIECQSRPRYGKDDDRRDDHTC